MYWQDSWEFKDSVEYEYKFAGRYGARGEKRGKRKKPTPEQMKKQNQLNKENYVRRLMKKNFAEGDLWCTLKYPRGTRKPLGEVKKDIRRFLEKARKEYKARGDTLKFIYRLEIGKHGGIHIHILVNRIRGKTDTDIVIKKCWVHGRIHYTPIDEYGGFRLLANYIVKQPDDEQEGQLSLFPEAERKEFGKYSSSRNLIRPQPKRKIFKRRTVRKLIEEGPKARKGFYIDKETLHSGVNRFTGYSYLRYTECRITAKRQDAEGGG